MNKTIIAVCGNPNSGKSTVSQHLAGAHGFTIFRPSELIRQFGNEQNLPLRERRDYARAHMGMLAVYGDTYIPDTVLALPDQRIVVDGERVPVNIRRLQQFGAAVLSLECPVEVRYERAMARGESRDKTCFVDFVVDEARESNSDEPPYLNTAAVMAMADYTIDAAQPLEAVLAQVDEFVALLLTAQQS